MRNLLIVAIIAAAAYWYWSGPYQSRVNPNYEEQLERNDKAMELCIHTANYQAGIGNFNGDPESHCAQENNVYFEDDHWHSYDGTRPESSQ